MKRHKKKRQPKSISRRKAKWFDPTPMIAAVNVAMGSAQVNLALMQPNSYPGESQIRVVQSVINTALSLIKITKQRKQFRFKATGRYEH